MITLKKSVLATAIAIICSLCATRSNAMHADQAIDPVELKQATNVALEDAKQYFALLDRFYAYKDEKKKIAAEWKVVEQRTPGLLAASASLDRKWIDYRAQKKALNESSQELLKAAQDAQVKFKKFPKALKTQLAHIAEHQRTHDVHVRTLAATFDQLSKEQLEFSTKSDKHNDLAKSLEKRQTALRNKHLAIIDEFAPVEQKILKFNEKYGDLIVLSPRIISGK
jgi:chromosome segregation ATPase